MKLLKQIVIVPYYDNGSKLDIPMKAIESFQMAIRKCLQQHPLNFWQRHFCITILSSIFYSGFNHMETINIFQSITNLSINYIKSQKISGKIIERYIENELRLCRKLLPYFDGSLIGQITDFACDYLDIVKGEVTIQAYKLISECLVSVLYCNIFKNCQMSAYGTENEQI